MSNDKHRCCLWLVIWVSADVKVHSVHFSLLHIGWCKNQLETESLNEWYLSSTSAVVIFLKILQVYDYCVLIIHFQVMIGCWMVWSLQLCTFDEKLHALSYQGLLQVSRNVLFRYCSRYWLISLQLLRTLVFALAVPARMTWQITGLNQLNDCFAGSLFTSANIWCEGVPHNWCYMNQLVKLL